MRDYQPTKNNPYYIEPEIYKAIIYIIRSYDAQKKTYNLLLEEKTHPHIDYNSPGHSSRVSDPTGETASRLAGKSRIISAIDEARADFEKSAKEVWYIKGIWNNILYSSPYPFDADKSTYARHKARFIYLVGKKLNMI